MTPYAYMAGRLAAFDRLGLSKLAAINARTMLPPAMLKGVGEAAEAALGVTKAEQHLSPEILAALKTTGRTPAPMLPPAMRGKEKALYEGVAEMSPTAQTMHAMGPSAGAAEHPGSQWIRNELAGQLKPADVGALREVGSGAMTGAEGAGATVRPPRRPKAPPPPPRNYE